MPINDRLDGPEPELYDETPPRSIFAATWFRALLVLIVVAVVGAITAPYIFDAMKPSAKISLASRATPTPTAVPIKAATSPAATAATPSAPTPSAPMSSAPMSSATAPSTPVANTPLPNTSVTTAPVASTPVPSTPLTSAPVPSATSPSAMSATQTDKSDKAPAEKNDIATAAETKPHAKPAATKRIAARSTIAASAPAPSSGDWWVQVGAFRNEATANKLTARLRAQNYAVEQHQSGSDASHAAAKTNSADKSEPAASGSNPTGADQYDVYVSGVSTSELTARLAARGLTAQPSISGSVIKPSLPLRDAVALSKDLAVDGLKVQVRRAASTAAAGATAAPTAQATATRAPAPSAGDTIYRVRVGAFPDRATAMTTLKELEAKGYAPFIARGAP